MVWGRIVNEWDLHWKKKQQQVKVSEIVVRKQLWKGALPVSETVCI